MTESADLPLSCEHRNICLGSFNTVKFKDDLLVNAGRDLRQAEERINELEKQLLLRTASAEISRERDLVKALQAADVSQRRTIDNLSGEAYELRNILRAKGFDMTEVSNAVGESLEKYRLAIEADR